MYMILAYLPPASVVEVIESVRSVCVCVELYGEQLIYTHILGTFNHLNEI